MEWFKLDVNNVLYNHEDLSDKEFRLLVKSMALTASMESIPNESNLKRLGHYKTLKSLQEGLNECSTDLQYMLNEVLIDAQDYLNKKSKNRSKKRQQRESLRLKSQNVPGDVLGDVVGDVPSQIREDKRRKEKKEYKNINKSIYNELIIQDKPKYVQYSKINPQTFNEGKSYRSRISNAIFNFYDPNRRGTSHDLMDMIDYYLGEDIQRNKDTISFLFAFNKYIESEDYKEGRRMNLSRFFREWTNFKVKKTIDGSFDDILDQFEQKMSVKETVYA